MGCLVSEFKVDLFGLYGEWVGSNSIVKVYNTYNGKLREIREKKAFFEGVGAPLGRFNYRLLRKVYNATGDGGEIAFKKDRY